MIIFSDIVITVMLLILLCFLVIIQFSKQFTFQSRSPLSLRLFMIDEDMKKILILGGSGFVGGNFIREYQSYAETSKKFGKPKPTEIISVSRRGIKESNDGVVRIISVRGDATNETFLNEVFSKYGPFDVCVHAMGLLLDSNSGDILKQLNKYASGSGSDASPDATYDKVTRLSAYSAIDNLIAQSRKETRVPAFIFISAAEAGWTIDPPVDWLRRYLIAKRQVENRLLSLNNDSDSSLRAVIFRPSLIWTWKRPQALISVVPFYAASKLGFPFVDRPTTLEDLVRAMVYAVEDNSVRGIKRFADIDSLVKKSPL